MPQVDRSAGRLALPQALEAAARDHGLTHIERATTRQRVTVVLTGRAGDDPVTLVVTRDGITPMAGNLPLLEALHRGTW
ncbi:hypothetical protein CCR87_05755, partial [Rhodobaculum claviforme]|nr:hypothetical protein [Rhodobaculum claviforme]